MAMLTPRDRHSSWVSPAHIHRGRHRSPPPVQALEYPTRPESPVIVLPAGHGTPPEEGLALTWPTQPAMSQEYAESASIKDSSGRDMATYHARAIVTVSPSGETTMHIQSSYYSVRSPDGSGSGMRLHHSPSSGGTRGYSTPGRSAKQLTFPGTPGNKTPQGSARFTTTPRRSSFGTLRPTSSNSPKPGRSLLFEPSSTDSTIRRRNLPALPYGGGGGGDERGNDDTASRTHRTFRQDNGDKSDGQKKRCSDKGSYKGILEQDHPEEPSSRGRGTICSYICTLISLLLLLVLIILLIWIFVPFGDPVLKIGMAPTDAISMLKSDVDRNIFGQHLANKLVVSALYGMLLRQSGDDEPVVMSFHGGSGVGKTHMADILAKHFQEHNAKTQCSYTFLSDLHIPPSDSLKVPEYEGLIQSWVNDHLRNCKSCKPLFLIFDELRADAPAELAIAMINVLSEIKLRRSNHAVVVIIMSDIGMHDINTYMSGLWDSGTPRANTTLDELVLLIQNAALFLHSQESTPQTEIWPYQSKRGPFSALLSLVDHIVPFLPLERGHVKLCIMHNVISKGVRLLEEDLTWVADQLTYFPASSQVFSLSGCKKVSEKVDLLQSQYDDQ
ncbi:uncharacterized protein [Amphiura filiformis]|uniref:uncharacterized protein n=1 Tax=Amphiura filiformis TaxID=82378 RepID=UPI003B220456